MKKKFVTFILVLVSASSIDLFATASPLLATLIIQDDKVKIKNEELPESIKETLKKDEFKDWLVQSAYLRKSSKQYEVELKKGQETKTVKFDKEGKELK